MTEAIAATRFRYPQGFDAYAQGNDNREAWIVSWRKAIAALGAIVHPREFPSIVRRLVLGNRNSRGTRALVPFVR